MRFISHLNNIVYICDANREKMVSRELGEAPYVELKLRQGSLVHMKRDNF
jgi:hypothetical protein